MAQAVARSLRHLRRIPPLAVDAALGALFVVMVAAEAAAEPMASAPRAQLATLTLVIAVCVALRRRFPFAAIIVASVALAAESFLQVATEFSPLATFIVAYSVGQYATAARARWGALIIVAGVLAFFAAPPGLQHADPVELLSVLFSWLMAWGVGYSIGRRREEQERARQALERQVIAEERIRVSRELHDIVGHTVNLLVVQAGAARLMLDTNPAMTRSLLQGMEDAGRATLADLDRVLATLRDDDSIDGNENAAVLAPGLAHPAQAGSSTAAAA
jgi:signal transduction histidine kinase